VAVNMRVRATSKAEVISMRIKETRELRGLTASELARRVGVTSTAVWNWEKNSIRPRPPMLDAIARVLGVSVSFLLTGHDEIREVDTAPKQVPSVASILEDTTAKLAQATGLAPERIRLNVQFITGTTE
jgi:transcriptional regulator with XRE-family HTH domain